MTDAEMLELIEGKLASIYGELRTINDELDRLIERMARAEADLAWAKWFVIAIAGGMIAVLIRMFLGG